ncbi:MAG: multidrug transporter, partial [Candidatus Thiodiazotropha sp.]
IRCVGNGYEYDTTNVNHQTVLQTVVDDAQPGDTIKIQGGTYTHNINDYSSATFIDITNSGEAGLPITIEPLDGQSVHLQGFGFTEGTTIPTPTTEHLIRVTGDYIQIKNIEISGSTRGGMSITGSYGLFENLEIHDNWDYNIIIGELDQVVEGNVLRYIEVYRSRHGSGIYIYRNNTFSNLVQNNIIEDSIAYHNGYQPDGQKVPAINGDPAGGGNSDGIVSSKNCSDLATDYGMNNRCLGNIIRNNIVWHNADDGFDMSMGDGTLLENNIAIDNGPEGSKGFKGLRYVLGHPVYIGNIALSNYTRGYELRAEDTITLYHNAALHQNEQGIMASITSPSVDTVKVKNNLSVFNGFADLGVGTVVDSQSNWSEDSDGNPQLSDNSFDGAAVDLNFAIGATVQEKLTHIRTQFETALTPTAGSPLIDAGVFVPGMHCATADDDAMQPMPLSDTSCRHWKGNSPDIGPYEY